MVLNSWDHHMIILRKLNISSYSLSPMHWTNYPYESICHRKKTKLFKNNLKGNLILSRQENFYPNAEIESLDLVTIPVITEQSITINVHPLSEEGTQNLLLIQDSRFKILDYFLREKKMVENEFKIISNFVIIKNYFYYFVFL